MLYSIRWQKRRAAHLCPPLREQGVTNGPATTPQGAQTSGRVFGVFPRTFRPVDRCWVLWGFVRSVLDDIRRH